jgi:diguanylate cyclase (GGDEF)-like protein
MPDRRRQLKFRGLIAIAAALIAMAVLATVLAIVRLRADAMRDAERDAGNIASVLAEQTAGSVRAIDLTLSELQDRIAAAGTATPKDFGTAFAGRDVFLVLQDMLARLSQVDVITLVDAEGRIINNSRAFPSPAVNLFDRDYFQDARRGGRTSIFVSTPLTNRVSGSPGLVFSRRLESRNGTFLGAALIGLDLKYFQHVYESITALTDQSFLFLRRDGVVLVRYPDPQPRTGERMPAESPWYGIVANGGGYFRTPGVFDGIPRVVAVRPLADYPLVVNIAMSETAALAQWRHRATIVGSGAALTLLGFAFLLRAFVSQFRALSASEESVTEREARLSEKSGELACANMHLDAALNNMSQGLCLFDASGRIVVCNHQYLQMYGLSSAVVRPGCGLRELIAHRKQVGYFTGDVDEYCNLIVENVAKGEPFASIVEASDGRVVHVLNRPIASGGWVATHEDVTERARDEARIAHMARHDSLTDLANRVLFMEKMDDALARLAADGTQFSVFVFDLDLFKAVNDSLGHPTGDRLLVAVAQRLGDLIGKPNTIGRLGGDEFAILQVVQRDARSEAAELAGRLIEAVGAPYEIEGNPVTIGISLGIALAPADGTETSLLLKNADLALYRAKSDGRNCFRFYQCEMDAAMRLRRSLQIDLRNALPRGEFELHYQAIVDAATGTRCGAEALVRWRHPGRGLIGPDEFIPLAEDIGLIDALGEWILQAACAEAATWPDHVTIAVNLSAVQFRKGNLAQVVTAALAGSGLGAQRLELEVTESVLLQKSEANLAMLHAIKRLGVSIVLDDFGTGYSSLSYLRIFPFDKIKIDRSFVRELTSSADCAAIVSAIAGLARSLDMVTTAEGVETDEQLTLVRLAGCNQAQGFLFARPVPAAQLDWTGLRPAAMPLRA